MGQILGPVKGRRPGGPVLRDADEAAVGRDLEPGRDRGHDLAGGLVVRVVETGEPVVDVVGPGIGPDEPGIVGRFVHELEPFPGFTAVVDAGEGHDLAELRRAGQEDLDRLVRLFEAEGRPVVVDDLGHGEFFGVEDAGLEAVPERRQGDRRRPVERLAVEVEPDVDQIVKGVEAPAALGLERFLGIVDGLPRQGRSEAEDDEDDGEPDDRSSHVPSPFR